MKLNKYSYFLVLFIFFDVYSEIKILIDHITFHALYFAFLRHPLAFFMIFTFPYLNMKLNKLKLYYWSKFIVSLIITCITNARGKDKIRPNGPNINVNPNCDMRVRPGSKFVFFFIMDGIII